MLRRSNTGWIRRKRRSIGRKEIWKVKREAFLRKTCHRTLEILNGNLKEFPCYFSHFYKMRSPEWDKVPVDLSLVHIFSNQFLTLWSVYHIIQYVWFKTRTNEIGCIVFLNLDRFSASRWVGYLTLNAGL